MSRTFRGSFSADADGFLSRSCQRCRGSFKQRVVDGVVRTVACPFCGARGDEWNTAAQQSYLEALVQHEGEQLVAEQMQKMMKGFGTSGSGLTVKVTTTSSVGQAPAPPRESSSGEMEETTVACCSQRVRHVEGARVGFCAACGDAYPAEAAP